MTNRLNSIEKAEYINTNLKRYIKSTFQIDDDVINGQFNQRIDSEELVKGPYISGRLPFVAGKSINELIEEGILSKEFIKMSALHLNRPLYKHQEEAIRKSVDNMNLVVSTGTGSGKTESFLIPILNEISRDIENGKANRGIQALLLYPLNALANDQRSRVREILKDYPQITFGFFTGETLDTEKNARKEYRSEFNAYPPSNEIISREVSRENPPNILFTNYSMLEYLLIRPTDQNLFSQKNTSQWKYVVLDEAHTYKGALGIEISYLMKRLLSNINSKPKFILTSATLATNSSDFPKVVEFAQKLTSQKFTRESIIISEFQKYIVPKTLIDINPEMYSKLGPSESFVLELYRLHFSNSGTVSSIKMLRELILHSKDFYRFIYYLEKPIKAKTLIKLLGDKWTEQHLSDYLDLLAKINNQDTSLLFDVRYHTFIKTLDGAYVALRPNKKLNLKKTSIIRLGEGEHQDEVKALQLGMCRYCSIPYVIGHIVDNVFHQVDDEELYEIYGEENHKNVDILLVKEYVNINNIDMEKKIQYTLCNKCGVINDSEVINPVNCDCGSSYQVELIGYDKSDLGAKTTSNIKTNIHKCISCNSINNSGVVSSFYMGKDAATAIIGQLLYQSMEMEVKEPKISKVNHNPFLAVLDHEKIEESYRKQYITFSDSRQQASFFALFFQNQHLDFLRKKLVLDAVKNKENQSINSVQKYIQYRIEEERLLPDDIDSSDQGWISILIELLDVNRKFSLSGLGQLSFSYSISEDQSEDELMQILNSVLRSEGINYEMSSTEFNGVINFILNSMRRIPAIHYKDRAQLSMETRAEYLSYRKDDRSGLVLSPEGKEKYQTSLMPSRKSGNVYTSYIMRSMELSIDESKVLLDLIWNYLSGKSIFVQNDSKVSNNINIDNIFVTDGKFVNWYQCSKCKTITDLNLKNTCVNRDCEGELFKVDIDDVMKTNFYVREYKDKIVEKILIQEHTAQINNKDARKIQKDFTEGKINILSSSTTFEMGVDVGTLDTVYMRNVPPLPANYVQRAGRAGRSKETAAFAITFASNSSHDYTFFENPLKMIDGKIEAPYFDVDNSKISNRHITSFVLSNFFRKHPEYFDDSKLAVDREVLELFLKFVEEEKENIISFVENNNIAKSFREQYPDWLDENIVGDGSKVNIMFYNHTNKIRQLKEALNEAISTGAYSDSIRRTLKDFENQSILNRLSQYGVIPSYGFPVDSVSLNVPDKSDYKLDRDLGTAISEYAPSSEIIVKMKKYRSRYINVGGRRSLPNYFYVKCDECNMLTHSLNENDPILDQCKNCYSENLSTKQKFIIPINGFTSELHEVKDAKLKPKKTYSSDYFFVGNNGDYLKDISIKNTIRLRSSMDTELAVLNESAFYMCETCGYTELSSTGSIFPNYDNEHAKPGSRYSCTNTRLTSTSLGHTFFTDVVIFDILVFEYNDKEIRSFMFALLEGISIGLEIERSDINGIIQQIEGKSQIILFDSVPGGAGHVRRILDETILSKVIEETLNKVNQDCCDESSSCYNCLRNYKNQRIHPLLKRGDARRVARDVQIMLNKNNSENQYTIENEMFQVSTWSKLNEVFEDEFIDLESNDVELPSHAYSDLFLNNKKIEVFLIWESKKIAVVTNGNTLKQSLGDWQLFSLDDKKELLKKLVASNG